MPPRDSTARRHLATSPFQPIPPQPPAEIFTEDDRVTHDRHGLGTVVSTGPEEWVTVRFTNGEVRRVNGRTLEKL